MDEMALLLKTTLLQISSLGLSQDADMHMKVLMQRSDNFEKGRGALTPSKRTRRKGAVRKKMRNLKTEFRELAKALDEGMEGISQQLQQSLAEVTQMGTAGVGAGQCVKLHVSRDCITKLESALEGVAKVLPGQPTVLPAFNQFDPIVDHWMQQVTPILASSVSEPASGSYEAPSAGEYAEERGSAHAVQALPPRHSATPPPPAGDMQLVDELRSRIQRLEEENRRLQEALTNAAAPQIQIQTPAIPDTATNAKREKAAPRPQRELHSEALMPPMVEMEAASAMTTTTVVVCKNCGASKIVALPQASGATAQVVDAMAKLKQISEALADEKAELEELVEAVAEAVADSIEGDENSSPGRPTDGSVGERRNMSSPTRQKKLPRGEQRARDALLAWKQKQFAIYQRRQRMLRDTFYALNCFLVPSIEDGEWHRVTFPESTSTDFPMSTSFITEFAVPAPRPAPVRHGSPPQNAHLMSLLPANGGPPVPPQGIEGVPAPRCIYNVSSLNPNAGGGVVAPIPGFAIPNLEEAGLLRSHTSLGSPRPFAPDGGPGDEGPAPPPAGALNPPVNSQIRLTLADDPTRRNTHPKTHDTRAPTGRIAAEPRPQGRSFLGGVTGAGRKPHWQPLIQTLETADINRSGPALSRRCHLHDRLEAPDVGPVETFATEPQPSQSLHTPAPKCPLDPRPDSTVAASPRAHPTIVGAKVPTVTLQLNGLSSPNSRAGRYMGNRMLSTRARLMPLFDGADM